jgi:hypothetical protein
MTGPGPGLPVSILRDAVRVAGRVATDLAHPVRNRVSDPSPDSPRWWDQSLSRGAPGVALLHAERAASGHGSWDTVDAWMRRATADRLGATPGCGLWFGAPAVAFAVRSGAPDRYPGAAVALRDVVERLVARRVALAVERITAARRPSRSEYDLVRGLTGLGAYLLLDPDRPVLHELLRYLVRLTEPLPADDAAGSTVPGWWTSDLPSHVTDLEFAHGQSDQGIAHGVAGPLALLALAWRAGVTVPGHLDALHRILTWFDHHRRDTDGTVWWPEHITLPAARARPTSRQRGPGRPSWCYGTPGIARAHQLAALALGDPHRQADAERALLRAVTDPDQLAMLTDPDLCHGWAGVLATLHCATRDAGSPELAARLGELLPVLVEQDLTPTPGGPCGLLAGPAGPGLVLHTLATDRTGSWTRCLLLA